MKKHVFVIAIVLLPLISQLTAAAFPPPQQTHAYSTSNPYPVQNSTYNRIIIQSGNNTYVTTSPARPKQSYLYKDFAAHQRYKDRNYYIPSYCMHDRYIYYQNGYNPFCGRYRQFGSGAYINF